MDINADDLIEYGYAQLYFVTHSENNYCNLVKKRGEHESLEQYILDCESGKIANEWVEKNTLLRVSNHKLKLVENT